MADWKVSKEYVEVKEHPGADKLDVLKVGEYQIVAKKGHYKTGDLVLIIPEKSILPKGTPLYDEYEKYLGGSDKNRVKGIRLRGEYSEAVTWPLNQLAPVIITEIDYMQGQRTKHYHDIQSAINAPVGEDISELLGITKYEAPIPVNMSGQVKQFGGGYSRNHDVYHYASYKDELKGNVIVTEKIHGSQLNYFLDSDGTERVSSKGLLKKGLEIQEDEGNVYWQAVRNCDLNSVAHELMYIHNPERIQIIGEVVPVQKGFSYGTTKPKVLLFDVIIDGHSLPFSQLDSDTLNHWVPVFHIGDINDVNLEELSKGKETVSGNALHIKEGIVVKDVLDNKASDGKRLILKVINPKYKDEDSFN